MPKAPKNADSRAKALAAMTKAELVKTIKQLDKRQTQLLNQIAAMHAQLQPGIDDEQPERQHATPPPPAFPWST